MRSCEKMWFLSHDGVDMAKTYPQYDAICDTSWDGPFYGRCESVQNVDFSELDQIKWLHPKPQRFMPKLQKNITLPLKLR